MDTDRNLLFGVLALQADLLTPARFAEGCSAWAARKDAPLADLLVERGWLTSEERGHVEFLLNRKLKKHGGDAGASLVEVTTDQVRRSLAGIDDHAIRHSAAGAATPPHGNIQLSTTAYVPAGRDRYLLSRLHATGGIGRVWLARDASLGRDVALKELRPERADQPVSWARFLREAQVTGQLEHPGIVPVYEVGRGPDDQAPFYTMRFVRGRTLADAARAYHERRGRHQAGPLELRELLTAFVGVCQAVAYAHSRGVLHRDLKPQNVVLGDYGEVIVLDWGLAKVLGEAEGDAPAAAVPVALTGEGSRDETVAGQVLGTPAYMAPEQAEGRLDLLDARTDVYGLGAVLYEVLTGRPPFEGADVTAVMRGVVHETPPPPRAVEPGAPRALEAVCLKALAKKPGERYATARELAGDVQRFLADEPVMAYRDPLSTRLTRWGRRHRALAAAGAVAVLAALGGLGAVLAVQARANADLAGKNTELAAANERERQRFNLALEAVRTFHTGVSEDVLLKQKEFAALRGKLLRQAREFYRKLQELLTDQADRDSRRSLAQAYYEVGKITREVETYRDALAVQQRALTLFEGLANEAPDDADLRHELGRCWLAVAELHLSQDGGSADAKAALVRAREALEAAVAARPSNLEARADLASALWLVAAQHSVEGHQGEAIAIQRRLCADLDALLTADPSSERVRQELVRSLDNLGLYLSAANRTQEAFAAYTRSRDLGEALVRDYPNDPNHGHELVRTLGNLAIDLPAAGRPDEAAAAFARARQVIAEKAEAYPTLLLFRRDSAWIESSAAWGLIEAGRGEEALAPLERARVAREALLKANPEEVRSQQQLAWILRKQAWIHQQAGRFDRGREPAGRAVALLEKVAGANRDRPDLQDELRLGYCDLGDLELAAGRPAVARQWFEKALEQQRRLAQAAPSDLTARAGHAAAIRHVGTALLASGHPADAIEHYRRSLARLESIERPTAVHLYDMACCRALIAGAAAAPGSGLSPADTKAEAARAVALVRRAFAAGYGNLAWARDLDTDLKSIRGRPDFQALMAELATSSQGKKPGP
jgi:serine/threonine-protein kinase